MPAPSGLSRDEAAAVASVAQSILFHARGYAASVGRTFASRLEAARHYLDEGGARGIAPHPVFHLAWYRSEHPELAGGNPLLHFLARRPQERTPHPQFDPGWYLARYADVAWADLDPLWHFLRHGAAEGRDPGPFFSTRTYLAAHPGIDGVRVNPLAHHLAGRAGRPFEPLGRVVVLRSPGPLATHARIELPLRLDNTSDGPWSPRRAAPPVIGQRWLPGDGHPPAGGRRTLVPVEIAAGGSFWMPLAIDTPAEAGRHLLQLCLIPADGIWPGADARAGVTLVPVDIRSDGARAMVSRWTLPVRPPQAVIDEAEAIRAARPVPARPLAERMADHDRARCEPEGPRPFARGTRPVIRWIKGDGQDDVVTRAAIAQATRLFGNRVDYCLCTNGISGARARAVLAHASEPVELWPLTAADNPWLARRLATAGCYPDRFGYWWKWFPERVRPDAPEWILDGDMVVTGAPPWFAAWCDGRDGVRVTQDDRPHPWTMYGAFHAQVDRRLGLYSGLISLPPGHSYRAAFEAALAAPGLQPGHDGRLHMDEQGVVAVAFQNAGALPIPLYELPFARGPERTLDFGMAGDRGCAWGFHFSFAFRGPNRHFERMVTAGMIPDCSREPPEQERFRWLANRGQWGEPGWSATDAFVARTVAAARRYAGGDALEIGTSRGHLAAVLAALGCRVTTVDAADRGARDNLADMGVDVRIADGADFLAVGDRRFDLVVVDLHGNGPDVWTRLWPLLTTAVRPGGRLVVNNTHLWRSPVWRAESGLRAMIEQAMDGWDAEVFPEPYPGMAIWTRVAA
ncbi:MAG: class I SAM-dependent methyltransferase [Alphaproteobacteria bacterium]|nr:class I SAM-dependent methyltransferase [Alphaproteobacteria bacterium]